MIGPVRLQPGKPVIAGIVNVTPDSFSDGGLSFKKGSAVKHAMRLIEEGADILDIGGESTRPGAEPVTAQEEIKRVVPVIRELRKKTDAPISIDTQKAEVASAAVNEGADIINDVGGFRDDDMLAVAAKLKKPVITMHMKGTPRTMQKNPRYKDVVKEVASALKKSAENLGRNGVKKIIIDPGIGFGKSLTHNLELLNNIEKIVRLGYPVMVGASRKSFIAQLTDSSGRADGRLGGSITAHLMSVMQGAAVIRVHDVAPHVEALKTLIAIAREKK
jgi:dihydropteroate synthase